MTWAWTRVNSVLLLLDRGVVTRVALFVLICVFSRTHSAVLLLLLKTRPVFLGNRKTWLAQV